MLYEIRPTQQHVPDLRHRWFTSDCGRYNLYLWQNRVTGELQSLQWNFPCEIRDVVVRWERGGGLNWGVEVPEDSFRRNRSPLIRDLENPCPEAAVSTFRYLSAELEPALCRSVLAILNIPAGKALTS